jgi:sphingolipid 4-desaturase/C4-monooxygenase
VKVGEWMGADKK